MNIKPAIKKPLGLILALIGIVLVVIVLVTTLMADRTTQISVSAEPDDGSAFIYTAPGVLNLVNTEVTITARADEGTVYWAVGDANNVAAYIGDSAATEVTGLKSWEQVSTASHDGTAEQAEIDAQAVREESWVLGASDMWDKQGSGNTTATVKFEAQPDTVPALMATTSTGAAPQVELTWIRVNTVNSPLPYVTIGLVVFIVGLFLLISENKQPRRPLEPQSATAAPKAASAEAETTVVPRIGDADIRGEKNAPADAAGGDTAITSEESTAADTAGGDTADQRPGTGGLDDDGSTEADAGTDESVVNDSAEPGIAEGESTKIESSEATSNEAGPSENDPSEHDVSGDHSREAEAGSQHDTHEDAERLAPRRRRRHGTVYEHTRNLTDDDPEVTNA
ncbi:MAG: hypothetical protein PUK40_00575 [Actinomycetaceae bacterium]|nr:hypothetical protein [Arcanobacterium sp.]MDD7504435.1 hypothetical protein [Actinomycetaceae bacterium]MDY6143379.1 hypothetical protein [Arcanobacterium sp.]